VEEIWAFNTSGKDPRTSPLYRALIPEVYKSVTRQDIEGNSLAQDYLSVQKVVVARSARLVCGEMEASHADYWIFDQVLSHDQAEMGPFRDICCRRHLSFDTIRSCDNEELNECTPLGPVTTSLGAELASDRPERQDLLDRRPSRRVQGCLAEPRLQ
jgi:hypothetical protein